MKLPIVPKDQNFIHSTAIIDPMAKLGLGNYIGPYCIVGPTVELGNNNRLEAFCTLGAPAEHQDYFRGPVGKVCIGNENIFREFVSIQAGTEYITKIGNGCRFLTGSYVAHDCFIADKVMLSGHAKMGGKVYVCEGANLGLGCNIHQYAVLGAYSMLGMGCGVTKTDQIHPCRVYVGVPAKELKINQVAIDRNLITKKILADFETQFHRLSSLSPEARLFLD